MCENATDEDLKKKKWFFITEIGICNMIHRYFVFTRRRKNENGNF